MPAYKFTAGDAVSVFTRFPVAGADRRAPGRVGRRPRNGAGLRVWRACLPRWRPALLAGREFWEVELAGDVIESSYQLVASRGRLLGRIAGWPELERPFAEACAAPVYDLAAAELRRMRLTDLAAAMVAADTTAELAGPEVVFQTVRVHNGRRARPAHHRRHGDDPALGLPACTRLVHQDTEDPSSATIGLRR